MGRRRDDRRDAEALGIEPRRRRRRGRKLLVLGGMAAAAWAWRNHQLDANERRYGHGDSRSR